MKLIPALLAALLLAGCGSTTTPPAQVGPSRPPPSIHVPTIYVMHADGTAESADVTYTKRGGTSQATVSLPMYNSEGDLGVRFTDEDVPDFLYILVQNSSAVGTVECSIQVDGVTVVRNESSADYGIATCEYSP